MITNIAFKRSEELQGIAETKDRCDLFDIAHGGWGSADVEEINLFGALASGTELAFHAIKMNCATVWEIELDEFAELYFVGSEAEVKALLSGLPDAGDEDEDEDEDEEE